MGNEQEAISLLTLACPTNVNMEYIAPELAAEQTLSNLDSFGRRLNQAHKILVRTKRCRCNRPDSEEIPYTLESITEYMVAQLPNQGGEVEDWVKGEFERFKGAGRSLPKTIKKSTIKSSWIPGYKGRGRKSSPRTFGGRVIRSSRTFG